MVLVIEIFCWCVKKVWVIFQPQKKEIRYFVIVRQKQPNHVQNGYFLGKEETLYFLNNHTFNKTTNI